MPAGAGGRETACAPACKRGSAAVHALMGRSLRGSSPPRYKRALRQGILIERQKSLGADTKRSEELLSQFERSQVIFEEDLDRIILERN